MQCVKAVVMSWAGRLGNTKEESLACFVSDGGFREGFLKVVTAELRLNECQRVTLEEWAR